MHCTLWSKILSKKVQELFSLVFIIKKFLIKTIASFFARKKTVVAVYRF